MRAATKLVLATVAFAAVHSLLASRCVKAHAARLMGERNRNAFYRPFYNAQAIVTSGALLAYALRLPDRPVWRVRGTRAWLLNATRVAILPAFYSATRQVGLARMSGLSGLLAWRRGEPNIPPEPEAQGPALEEGRPVSGPYRHSRHPLNFLAIPLIWLTPRLSRNRLVFNCAATLYFLIGSAHEEARLRQAYSGRYEAYRSRVRFLVGRKRHAFKERQGDNQLTEAVHSSLPPTLPRTPPSPVAA